MKFTLTMLKGIPYIAILLIPLASCNPYNDDYKLGVDGSSRTKSYNYPGVLSVLWKETITPKNGSTSLLNQLIVINRSLQTIDSAQVVFVNFKKSSRLYEDITFNTRINIKNLIQSDTVGFDSTTVFSHHYSDVYLLNSSGYPISNFNGYYLGSYLILKDSVIVNGGNVICIVDYLGRATLFLEGKSEVKKITGVILPDSTFLLEGSRIDGKSVLKTTTIAKLNSDSFKMNFAVTENSELDSLSLTVIK